MDRQVQASIQRMFEGGPVRFGRKTVFRPRQVQRHDACTLVFGCHLSHGLGKRRRLLAHRTANEFCYRACGLAALL